MNAIELERVNKHFGSNHAVRDMSMQIPVGSVYGFLGPNGAGKTTTIRMIMSILYPDSGRLQVLSSLSPESVKDRLGYLPEEKGLYKKMKTTELLAYFGTLKGLNRRDAMRRAKTLLEKFGLGETVNQRCDSLSKGMGQKVQIIAAIIHEPEIVILDEPFSGLDPINVEMVRDVILDLKAEGRTVLFSTHIMEQAEQLCDHVLLINQGQKILDGSTSGVKGGFDNTILIDYQGDPTLLEHAGVTRINNMGNQAELSLAEGANAQQVVMDLMRNLTINQFNVKEPSLHEIFVRVVGESLE